MRATRQLLRSIHKWLGLVLALQVLAWLTGGVVMSLIPIEMVRGSAWVTQPEEPAGPRLAEFRRAPAEVLSSSGGATGVGVMLRLGEPVYVLREGTHALRVVHAASGAAVPALDEQAALRLASSLHTERPAAVDAELLNETGGESRGLHAPVWRVRLADRWRSHVYLDPVTARLLAVRNDLWRVYDFFWMLHIMDFENRDDFNNGLLRGSSIASWFLGLSGAWLLFYSFGRRRTEGGSGREKTAQ
jgi:hypothetical protein